jgi:hypothetical protein
MSEQPFCAREVQVDPAALPFDPMQTIPRFRRAIKRPFSREVCVSPEAVSQEVLPGRRRRHGRKGRGDGRDHHRGIRDLATAGQPYLRAGEPGRRRDLGEPQAENALRPSGRVRSPLSYC